MGTITSDHPDVPAMRGLHLFHFVLSNCSQRVRLALEEKRLEWTSHHLDLPSNEHVTGDYRRINPRGVVPTLVHDGQVVIESNDILVYLEEHYPEVPLRPADEGARGEVAARLEESSRFQPALKVLSHERLFRPYRKVGSEEVALYERQHADPELVAFLRDYAEAGAAWDARVERATRDLAAHLDALESALAESPWLSGGDYGLADVSWVVNFHRLAQARVDVSAWPRFAAWGRRAVARPAFDRAVLSYRP